VLLPAVIGVMVAIGTGTPAIGEPSGQVESVETRDGVVRVLFSLRDLPEGVAPDLSSVRIDVDGDPQQASVGLASEVGDTLERSTVLAMDVSDSMAGKRFDAAREAALAFIDQAPADVAIGLVTFAGTVRRVLEPTQDRAAVRDAVNRLKLDKGTLLYDGIEESLEVLAGADAGSVVVLSDGIDTGESPRAQTIRALEASDRRVDVVALEQSGQALGVLEDLAAAGSGEVISADRDSLTEAFTKQAAQLESQLLITFDVPDGWDGSDATLSAAVSAGGVAYSDSALVDIPADTGPVATPSGASDPSQLPAAPPPRFAISRTVMLGGIGALALGGALMALLMSNAFSGREKQTLGSRLSPYGGGQGAGNGHAAGQPAPSYSPSVKQQAVELAEKAMSRGVDVSLARRLDAAGLKLNSAEWVLMHAGVAVAAAGAAFLLSGGRLLPTLLLLLLGAAAPWVYLSFKKSRRLKAFNGQLADTLQLISGSLSAGLSLAQSLDTVVREGNEPVSGEFRRALVEQRLGVEIETALEGVAGRMQSDDFAWVVMAIRIQREVGGNLSVLLTTVAATLREREYLRRQVAVLSAEGRLSAYILGGLPPLFIGYLAMARPEYLAPMYSTPLGWVMCGTAAVMMLVGVFWLKKSVKVEV
jgi:tight adherence protein B